MQQMKNACQLPVAVSARSCRTRTSATACRSAACWRRENAVIPYAVGVDIACRMKMTVLDLPVARSRDEQARLAQRDRARDALRHRRARSRRRASTTSWTRDWSVTPVTVAA